MGWFFGLGHVIFLHLSLDNDKNYDNAERLRKDIISVVMTDWCRAHSSKQKLWYQKHFIHGHDFVLGSFINITIFFAYRTQQLNIIRILEDKEGKPILALECISLDQKLGTGTVILKVLLGRVSLQSLEIYFLNTPGYVELVNLVFLS